MLRCFVFRGIGKEAWAPGFGFWGNAQDDPAITTISGTWKVVSYEDVANNTRIVKDSANSYGGLDVVLTFEGNRLSGRNTTNKVIGTFSYPGTREVQIQEFVGTEISEPEWGRLFTQAVYKLRTFTINNQYLTFYYNNGNNRITLEKQ